MIKIIAPNNQNKLNQQIKALEKLLLTDTNIKDKTIHQQALDTLKKCIK